MKLSIVTSLLFCCICFGQNNTDTSLYMKSDKITYLTDIGSESGDLYKTIGHHGPAIENEWMALRIYFSDKVAIDVYSKAKPGLELKKQIGTQRQNSKKKAGEQITIKWHLLLV